MFSAAWALIITGFGAASIVAAIVTWIRGEHVATPWLICGALACLLVIVSMAYVRAAKDRGRLLQESQSVMQSLEFHDPLSPRYEDSELTYRHTMPYGDWLFEHLIGVFNPGPNPAERVRVELHALNPWPRHDNGHPPVIPYVLSPFAGGNEMVGITIGPDQQEYWKVGYTSARLNGFLHAGGFAPLNRQWRGTPWVIDSDERIRFSYRIICEAGPPVEFSLVLYAVGDRLRLKLEG